MKYMTFNSSCSYAGIANMLEQYGFDTSDRTIAVEMKLPYLFSKCNDVYISGPMLQTAEWFNLYLNPLGYQLLEKTILSTEIIEYLKTQKTAMFGIKMENAGKHAVVYIGIESDIIVLLNNKWETEESPEKIRLTIDELQKRLDKEVVVATLEQATPQKVSYINKLEDSIAVLQANLSEIIELCHRETTGDFLRSKLNTLFRPLFLDGISMLNLIGEVELSRDFARLQQDLLSALRKENNKSIFLKDYISIENLQISVDKYINLIRIAMNNEK